MNSTPLDCQRHLFNLPADVSYLNCAYQSPKLKRSMEAAALENRRSSQPWTIGSDDFFAPTEKLRGLFARLIDAEPGDIAIVPSVSYGISTAAANLQVGPREHVVMLSEQFPSNVYPWKEMFGDGEQRLKVIGRPNAGDWTEQIVDAIDSNCAIVALPAVHWTDGYRLDLTSIGRKCRDVDASLVLDLTQSLGVMPFSVKETDVDFIAVASYKWLLGPLGLSFLYVNPRHHQGRPIEFGWLGRYGSQDFSSLVQYTDQYQAGARRYDAGQRTNGSLTAIATTALEQILDWGVDNVGACLSRLTGLIADKAAERELLCTPPTCRAPHLLGIELPAGHIERLSPALAANRVYASVRGNKLRVAPYLYNSAGDVDRLFEVIDRCG